MRFRTLWRSSSTLAALARVPEDKCQRFLTELAQAGIVAQHSVHHPDAAPTVAAMATEPVKTPASAVRSLSAALIFGIRKRLGVA